MTLAPASSHSGENVITAGGPTGSSSVIPVITWDAQGRLTAVTTATPGGITEKAYVPFTADVGITSATEATPTDIVSAGSVSYSAVQTKIEFYARSGAVLASGGAFYLNLWEDTTNLGRFVYCATPTATAGMEVPIYAVRYLTPSAGNHTYKISGWRLVGASGTNVVRAGAGGVGVDMPGFIRITTGS